MLAYILAVFVGTGSVGLYITAFFFPEIHRKQDFIWSGVGFLYALCLWLYAHQVTGGILIGQTASVALLGWFAWQIIKLRRQLVPVSQQTPMPDMNKLQTQLGLNRWRSPSARETMPKVAKPAPKTATSDRPTTQVASPSAPQSAPRRPGREESVPATKNIPTAPVTNSPPSQKIMDVEREVPPSAQNIPQSTPNPPTENIDVTSPDEEQAWIKLEIKPSPAAQTLGAAVKPPETNPAVPQPTVIMPKTVASNLATDSIDSIETTTEVDTNWQE